MIPFNKPYYSGNELKLIRKVMNTQMLSGDIEVIRHCQAALQKKYGFNKVFLTNSCTMALELSASLAGIGPGDEVIIPSYTYVSTANAFAARGAKIVFADSMSAGPNMEAGSIASLITPRTKAIVAMHYAGIACDMEVMKQLTETHQLVLIEDAAQCIDARHRNLPLGSIGRIGCFSFHETKNIHCGEGGFIVINDPALIEKAEIIRNKGTNREAFIRGEVSKYEWLEVGHATIPNGLSAAFLMTQIEQIDAVQKKRLKLWERYEKRLSGLAKKGIQLPFIPDYASNNAHIFYIVCRSEAERKALIGHLRSKDIQAVFHYQSLHQSPYFKKRHDGRELPNADRYSSCLLRLPLYYELSLKEVDHICEEVLTFYNTYS